MDAAFTWDGVVTTSQKIHDIRSPPAVARITEVIGIQHAGQHKAALMNYARQLFKKRGVIREMVEDRKVRRDCMHLAGERRGNLDDGFAGDFVVAVLRQVCAHCFRRVIHESQVSVSGISLCINAGTSTEIEHVGSGGQQVQRDLLKAVAHDPVPLRGQHEVVVLLSDMHVVDYLADKLTA